VHFLPHNTDLRDDINMPLSLGASRAAYQSKKRKREKKNQ